MKISERKRRLRTRGVVPVSQQPAARSTAVQGARRERGAAVRATSGRKGAAAPAPRPRWQPGPTYQIIFGGAYIVFSPLLFLSQLANLYAPHSKYHPGSLEAALGLAAPVAFFLFGVWWVYRGLKARRTAALSSGKAGTDAAPASSKARTDGASATTTRSRGLAKDAPR